MMRLRSFAPSCFGCWLSVVLLPSAGFAQAPPSSDPAAAPAPETGNPPAGDRAAAQTSAVPQDPSGVKGLSPFWESLKLGDSAYLARDYDNAIGQYRDAITKDPQNPIGHLRIAEAHLKKGELNEARQAIDAASRFADKQPSLKAKALFLAALLEEQQKAFDPALEAWKAYQAFARQQPKAKVHERTPPERQKRIQEARRLSTEYAAVKERIAKRLKEAEEKAKQSVR